MGCRLQLLHYPLAEAAYLSSAVLAWQSHSQLDVVVPEDCGQGRHSLDGLQL